MSFNIQNILKDVCEYKEASIRCLFVLCLTDVRCFKYVEVFKEAFEYTEGSKKCLCIYRSLQKRSLKTQKNLKYLCEYIYTSLLLPILNLNEKKTSNNVFDNLKLIKYFEITQGWIIRILNLEFEQLKTQLQKSKIAPC